MCLSHILIFIHPQYPHRNQWKKLSPTKSFPSSNKKDTPKKPEQQSTLKMLVETEQNMCSFGASFEFLPAASVFLPKNMFSSSS
ncbi:hypothetical protein NPIL_325241 [Nephila pilipes]|uniref:Uncharacterized protein n=1 Tax=Nephila pilipes TaxID=299642 RepID=A0A8X6MUQ3_NEPPI|nr:hypothetical protein NPIL_325241 [Nephila pilipes]